MNALYKLLVILTTLLLPSSIITINLNYGEMTKAERCHTSYRELLSHSGKAVGTESSMPVLGLFP